MGLSSAILGMLGEIFQKSEALEDLQTAIVLVFTKHFHGIQQTVTTECGEEWRLENGYWTDGDFVQAHCPTDGFFMGQDGQVVQLKATEQYANGKYWLGEIQVDADDMRSLNFYEMDGYPGYVGMPPEPRQVFEVESDVEEAIAQIQDLHPGLKVIRFPWCLSSILYTVYVCVLDDLEGEAIVYQIDRRSPKLF